MVWPTSGSQISTTIRSALSRSLVALISIQLQDAGLPFKGRARVVTESEKRRGTLIIWQLPSAALQTGPLFAKTGTSTPPRRSHGFVPGRTNRP